MLNQNGLFLEGTRPAEQAKGHIILPPPKLEPAKAVFAEAILDESSARQRRSPLEWVVSIGIHAGIVVAFLMLPLYFTSRLDLQKFDLTYLALPPAPPAPPPPPLAASATPRPVRTAPVHVYVPGKLTAPSFIPSVVAKVPNDASALDAAASAVPGGVLGGVPGGQLGGVLGGILGGDSKLVPPPPPAQGPKTPVLVGGDVKPPRLLYGPAPDYPILAKQSHITGTVVIDAVIDEHGKVEGMRALSGPPILIPAAMAAVSKRRYEPTVLDGQPTPIDLRVEVDFQFS